MEPILRQAHDGPGVDPGPDLGVDLGGVPEVEALVRGGLWTPIPGMRMGQEYCFGGRLDRW